jgi:hypothetical protein
MDEHDHRSVGGEREGDGRLGRRYIALCGVVAMHYVAIHVACRYIHSTYGAIRSCRVINVARRVR